MMDDGKQVVYVLQHWSFLTDPFVEHDAPSIIGVFDSLDAAQKRTDDGSANHPEWRHVDPDPNAFVDEQWFMEIDDQIIKIKHTYLIVPYTVEGDDSE